MASPSPARPSLPASWRAPGLAAALIVLATFAAYAGSFSGPFVFDDLAAIPHNPSLRHLASALFPPRDSTVGGRPLVNLSLALNYAVSGTRVGSYHVTNLAIHILAALALFGIVRRTLARWSALSPTRVPADGAAQRVGVNAFHPTWLALAVALLWALHPLQTESVTYVVQRAESLMGLLYLLTLYCFIRGVESSCAEAAADEKAARPASFLWLGLSWLACLFGMATKEVMVTAPVMVFLYDRTFVGGSCAEAWRRRRGFYLSLAGTWLLLAWLVAADSGRGGTAGFGAGVPWWAYALTQFRAVAHYLRLSLWPHPLVADYGRALGGPPPEVAFDAVVVGLLAAATLVALWRRPAAGFIGAWFFVILAPSSSVVPVATEIIAEHRMYLPLAAVVVAAVLGLNALLERVPWLIVCGLAAVGCGLLTARRNEIYQSDLALWSDVVAKVPDNAGARNNLGNLYFERGDGPAAVGQYREALRLVPEYADAHYNLGLALAQAGQWAEAAEHEQAALRFRPDDAAIHGSLGLALLQLGRLAEARGQFEQALRLDPARERDHYNLGNTWLQEGQAAAALREYEAAVALRPDDTDARLNLGNLLAQQGRRDEAIRAYEEVLRTQAGAADVHNNLGILLAEAGRWPEAEKQFREALRLQPDYAEAGANLARLQALERSRSSP